jgi:hypothetical protein
MTKVAFEKKIVKKSGFPSLKITYNFCIHSRRNFLLNALDVQQVYIVHYYLLRPLSLQIKVCRFHHMHTRDS